MRRSSRLCHSELWREAPTNNSQFQHGLCHLGGTGSGSLPPVSNGSERQKFNEIRIGNTLFRHFVRPRIIESMFRLKADSALVRFLRRLHEFPNGFEHHGELLIVLLLHCFEFALQFAVRGE